MSASMLGLLMAWPAQALEVVYVQCQVRVLLQWLDVVYLGGYGYRSLVLPYAFLAQVVVTLQRLHPHTPPRWAMVEALLFQRFCSIFFLGDHISSTLRAVRYSTRPYRTALYAAPLCGGFAGHAHHAQKHRLQWPSCGLCEQAARRVCLHILFCPGPTQSPGVGVVAQPVRCGRIPRRGCMCRGLLSSGQGIRHG